MYCVTGTVYYLSNHRLPGLVVLEEEVVSLNEKLAGVFLHLGHPPFPQQHGVIGADLGVKLLVRGDESRK